MMVSFFKLFTIVVVILHFSQLSQSFRCISRYSNGISRHLNMELAPFKKPRVHNAPGNLFVDESCIDCDVCRWMCPSVYSRKGVKSIVHTQPMEESERLSAYAAMVACPVGAIRMRSPDSLAKVATELFPAEIDSDNIPGVHHLGYHTSASFGATPYFVKLQSGRNIMIDTPRYNTKLASSIEAEGGISFLILTHRDDVADHNKWKDRFPNLERIIHRSDVYPITEDCEIKLQGSGQWHPDPSITIIHTPGHTAGSLCIEVATMKDTVLFTGDHIAYSVKTKGLTGFKRYCKGNMKVQSSSMRMLANDKTLQFMWILPGHGRMIRWESSEDKRRDILQAADAFDAEDETEGMFALGYN